MADGNALSSLYPQPTQNTGFDASKTLGIVSQINQNNLFQKEFAAKQAVGEAAQGAIGPDGTYSPSANMNALSSNPAASFSAPEAIHAVLEKQGIQLGQNAAQVKHAAGVYGALSDIEKPTASDVHKATALIATSNPNIPAPLVNQMARTILADPLGIKHGAATLRNIALGPEGTSGRVSAAPAPGGAPQQQSVGAANYGGTAPVGLSPKETAAQTQTGAGAGSAINDARLHSLNYNQQVFPLEQAIPALEKLGKTGTGPGTEEFNHIKSFLQSAGIPGLDTEKIKTFDEAKKYLTDFVNQNGNTGTNDKLAASFAGNPSVGISNAAAIDVAKSALTLRRAKQAQLYAFETSGKSEEDYPKEAGKWAREHDPRAYGFDLMTPEARKKVLESLPAGKRELFMMDVQDALKNGFIKAPR